MNKNQLFRRIPKMDVLLSQDAVQKMIEEYGYDSVLAVLRRKLDDLRRCMEIQLMHAADEEPIEKKNAVDKQYEICWESFVRLVEKWNMKSVDEEQAQKDCVNVLIEMAKQSLQQLYRPHLKKVLNGTGTILHTNLGRAPLSTVWTAEAVREVSGYSNLEYDLTKSVRGNRGETLEKLLCEITGAEAALVVNNNAAAVLLVLNALAKGGEVIVSRGELVEIGGQFRIPDVMELSGARLVEVGTTNKTRILDYEIALTEDTKAFLKVHTSNYRVVGFTETTEVNELSALSKAIESGKQNTGRFSHNSRVSSGDREEETTGKRIPVIEDLGSGALIDLNKYGLSGEPFVQDALKQGADVVCFSADKLLGGPQAGIIVGSKAYVDQMRFNPYYRTMRIDKLTAAVLERVLLEYRSESRAVQNIPVLRMITKKPMDVEQDAKKLKRMLKRAQIPAEIELYPCESQIGGGSLPLTTIPSMAVALIPAEITVEELETRFRELPLPVIGRIEKGRLLLDMRTFEMEYISEFLKELKESNVFCEKNNNSENECNDTKRHGELLSTDEMLVDERVRL